MTVINFKKNKNVGTSPCTKDCPNRRYDCHFKGHCKAWDEWQAGHKEDLKKKKEENFKLYAGTNKTWET